MRQLTLTLIAAFTLILTSSAQQEKINWLTFEEAIKLNEKEPKLFFIDFYTDWCGWCKKLDQITFVDPEVVELINKHYYAIKFDGEYKEPIQFQGREYVFYKTPEQRRGSHTLAAALMKNRMSYPTMVIMEVEKGTENVTFHNPLPGFMDGSKIEPILRYIGERLYQKDVDWQEYQDSYATKY